MGYIELVYRTSDFNFNLQIVKSYNTCYVSVSFVGGPVSNVFRCNEMGCNKLDSLRYV